MKSTFNSFFTTHISQSGKYENQQRSDQINFSCGILILPTVMCAIIARLKDYLWKIRYVVMGLLN